MQAIDIHAHFGPYANGTHELINTLMTATPDEIVMRARSAGIALTMVSPLRGLMPRFNADPVSANVEAARVVAASAGLMQWVVVDPLKPETFGQAEEMLKSPKCVGMKIHPEEHGYKISDQGRKIFEFAAEHGAVIQSHSGEENSMPEDFVPFADDFPNVRLVISHLGCNPDGDPSHHVRAIQANRHGNMYTDTSSAMSITPRLIEWAVSEIGAERILFGSDSPCYFAPMQRSRIDHAEISDEAKRRLLRENAIALFGISLD